MKKGFLNLLFSRTGKAVGTLAMLVLVGALFLASLQGTPIREFNNCYLQDYVATRALIIPHWGESLSVYQVDLTQVEPHANYVMEVPRDPDPNRATTRWASLSDNGNYAAVVDWSDQRALYEQKNPIYDGIGHISVYDLNTNHVVYSEQTSDPALVYWFNETQLIYVAYDGVNRSELWRTVSVEDWTRDTSLSYDPYLFPPQEIPAGVVDTIHNSAQFCRSWPASVPNPTATP